MSVRYDSKRKRWRAIVGSGSRRSCKDFSSKRDALTWEAQKKCMIDDHGFEKLDYDIITLIEEYLETLNNCVDNHVRDVRNTLLNFSREYNVKRLRDLTPSTLEHYKYDCNQSIYTNNRKIGFIKSLSLFASKKGYIKSDPLKWVTKLKIRKKDKKKTRVLNEDELNELFDSTKKIMPDMLPVLIFFCNTGCRLSELVTLEFSDVDYSKNTVRFIDKPHIQVRNENYTCKWGSQRLMPIKSIVKTYLLNQPIINNWIFYPEKKRNRLGEFIYRKFKKIVKNSNISRPDELKIHSLRHTWVSTMLQSGVPLPEVSKLAGHNNLTTTQEYAHLIGNISSLETSLNLMPDIGGCTKNAPAIKLAHSKLA